MYCAKIYPKSPTSMDAQMEACPYVARTLEEGELMEAFCGKPGWWGSAWGETGCSMSEHDPVLVCEAMKEKGKEQIILHVQKLGADYEEGIGSVKVADGSEHERENTMRVPLLTSEGWWRGNSAHANQLRRAISCFQEKIELEYSADGVGSVCEPKVGRIAVNEGSSQHTRAEFIADYIARSDGSYYAVCKSTEEPAIFVRVAVKEAGNFLVKGKVAATPGQSSTKKRKLEADLTPAIVDLNFFIDAISTGSLAAGHDGLVELCRMFRQAEVFLEKQAEIDELKQEHRKLSAIVQTDMANNVFDVNKMDRLSEIMKMLNALMKGVEEAPANIPPEAYLTPGQQDSEQ